MFNFPIEKIKLLVIPLIIFLLASVYYSYKVTRLNSLYFYDEAAWIGRSYVFELLVNGDMDNDLWKTEKVDGDPKIPAYIYGMAIYPSYLKEKLIKGGGYDMVQYLIDHNIYQRRFMNEKSRLKYDPYVTEKFIYWHDDGVSISSLLSRYGEGLRKTVDLIFLARTASVLVSSATLIIIYLLYLKLFGGLIIPLLLTVLYGLSSLISTYSTIAYSEGVYMLFFNIALLTITLYFSGIRRKGIFLIVFATAAAFLNQTKLNGIILLLSVLLVVNLDLIASKYDLKKLYIKNFVIVHIFIVIYIVLNPMLYRDPVNNMLFQYKWTNKISKAQIKGAWSGDWLPTVKKRFDYINNYFSSANNRGIKPSVPVGGKKAVSLLLFLAIIGFFRAAYILIRSRRISPETAVFILGLLTYTALLFYFALAWERYLVSLVPFIFYLVGQGMILLGQMASYALKLVNAFSHSNLKTKSHKKRLFGDKKII